MANLRGFGVCCGILLLAHLWGASCIPAVPTEHLVVFDASEQSDASAHSDDLVSPDRSIVSDATGPETHDGGDTKESHIPEPVVDMMSDSTTPENTAVLAKVRVPLKQRLCVAIPEIHGEDAFVRAQVRWMGRQLQDAGVSYLRYQLFWHRIEGKRGTFDFSRYDRAVEELVPFGVKLVGVLAYGNPWATQKTDNDAYFPPDDPADFARYVKETVSHYRGKVDRWEVWNEPNGGYRFWKTAARGDAAAYAALLVAAIDAVKSVAPTDLVSFAGLFFHAQVIMGATEFLQGAFEAQPSLAKKLDRIAIHPYTRYPPQAEPEQNDQQQISIVEMLRQTAAFLPQKPIWLTELGWPVYNKVTDALQAAYLSREMLLAFAYGAELACWYQFIDTDHQLETERGFGLFTQSTDWTARPPKAKPSYLALKALNTLAGDAETVEDVSREFSLQPGEIALRLQAPNRQILALWRTDNTPERTLAIALPVDSNAELFDVFAAPKAISPVQGKVSIALQNAPQFLVLRPK